MYQTNLGLNYSEFHQLCSMLYVSIPSRRFLVNFYFYMCHKAVQHKPPRTSLSVFLKNVITSNARSRSYQTSVPSDSTLGQVVDSNTGEVSDGFFGDSGAQSPENGLGRRPG